MEKQVFSRFHPMGRLGDAVDRGARAAQQGLRGAARSTAPTCGAERSHKASWA